MTTAALTVIGGGLAAADAVRALRKGNPDAPITVITAEPVPPDERPPLTKEYLRGTSERGGLFTLAPAWYAENNVEVRTLTTATNVDPTNKTVTLADASTVQYSKLLLATGSTPRPLRVPGADLRGVLTLRTLEDADLITQSLEVLRMQEKNKVVAVGDGWIGMEVAASARTLGFSVTVLGRGAAPLAHVLGVELGEYYRGLHESHGVVIRSGVEVVGLLGNEGRVSGVTLGDGSTVSADIVIFGVGVTPNVGLAAAAGLTLSGREVGGGVTVNAQLATSDPDIFAAGDIASVPLERWGRPVRVEHWANALRTGGHAGRAMLGADKPYERMPYFFSDQFDTTLEYAGFVALDATPTAPIISGDLSASRFAAFWLSEGRVTAALTVNVSGRTADLEAMINAEAAPTEEELRAFTSAATE